LELAGRPLGTRQRRIVMRWGGDFCLLRLRCRHRRRCLSPACGFFLGFGIGRTARTTVDAFTVVERGEHLATYDVGIRVGRDG
jgi:hypothetical protein